MTTEAQLAAYRKESQEKLASYRGFRNETPEVVFEKGARFFKNDKGDVMFAYKTSAVSEFVSKATDEQKAAWPKEWAAFRGLKPRKD